MKFHVLTGLSKIGCHEPGLLGLQLGYHCAVLLRSENPRVGSSILSLGTTALFAFVRACSPTFEFSNRIKML